MLSRIAENDRFRTFLRLSVQLCVLSVLPVPRRRGRPRSGPCFTFRGAEQRAALAVPPVLPVSRPRSRSRSQPTRGRAASDVRRPSRSRRAVPLGVLASSPSALAARSRPRRVTRARRPPLFVIIYPRARANFKAELTGDDVSRIERGLLVSTTFALPLLVLCEGARARGGGARWIMRKKKRKGAFDVLCRRILTRFFST